jgi:hypothetical protein
MMPLLSDNLPHPGRHMIWQLMKEGRAEEALRRVAGLRQRLSENLSEV